MIAYRRFIPRHDDQEGGAKAAKPAKREALGGIAPANLMLTLAKVESREAGGVGFSEPLAELSQPKRPGILRFSGFSSFSLGAPGQPAQSDPPTDRVVAGWAIGVGRLATMPAPNGYPPQAWQRALEDAERFMDRWARQAFALGWRDWEIWGVHRLSPWRRIDRMGLVPLLRGNRLTALTATEAVLVMPSGARQIHRRRPHKPLRLGERALLWELAELTRRSGEVRR